MVRHKKDGTPFIFQSHVSDPIPGTTRQYIRIPGYEHYSPREKDPIGIVFQKWLDLRRHLIKQKTVVTHTSRMSHAITFFRGRPLQEWRKEDGAKYVEYLLKDRGLHPNRVRRCLQDLSGLLRFAMDEGMIEKMPFEFRKVPKPPYKPPQKVPFTYEEHQRVIAEFRRRQDNPRKTGAYTWWPAACSIAWHTGMRLGDIAQLKVEDVDFGRGIILNHTEKTSRVRNTIEIPIEPELRPILLELRNLSLENKNPFMLPMMCAVYLDDHSTISHGFREVCDAIDLPNHSFHSYRHGFVTRLLNAGVDPITVSSMTGQSLEIIKTYAHISNDAKAAALARSRVAFEPPAQQPVTTVNVPCPCATNTPTEELKRLQSEGK